MTSERKRLANRANAAKSTGPKSVAGKRRSRNNALRHGFARSGGERPEDSEEIRILSEELARSISGASLETARETAAIEIEITQIRKARTLLRGKLMDSVSSTDREIETLNDTLRKLNDYERRALSRRKKVLNALLDGS